ncbi:hypothetical protein D039_3736B, partial [Vibrio parahaemolyticus EKP-028]
LYAGH